jgi:diketogulonate reductase-like aldo/keto reductase
MLSKVIPTLRFHTGNTIPQIGYGTYQLKGNDCDSGVGVAIKAGYNHIDTASIYGNEIEIASGLEPFYTSKQLDRSQLFITSKIAPAQQGYEQALSACETILKKLKTDYLDLLIIHWPGVSGLKPDDKVYFF